ncbi:MAG TPA: 6,7-dimethyl-8-ribityllumazine synthase [Gaiellaceae bacterium]|jgi:6,7-dimethyl-8-ribityllumazine synthase|nr:6,7-dimethyl-8-ribityllumazine synthase [Gaiellaceae bacterium]
MSMDEHDEFPRSDPAPTVVAGEPAVEAPAAVASPPVEPPAFEQNGEAPAESTDENAAQPEREPAEAASEPTEASPEPDSSQPEDPFAAWPQAESAAVIEDVPVDGDSVEHVAGEIDVPDGYTVLEGTPSGHRRSVAIVVARFNGGITNRMLASAIDTLEEAGVNADAVTIMPVPGAFELPLAAMALAKTRRYACVVALGAVVRGETPHFDFVASEAASGLQLAAIETGVPVAFGVLTTETVEQAEARIDRAGEAVRTALEMADVFAQLRASARA